ncbi:MAG: ABC transporter permease [Acholeplasmataceae bacterium]|nr:ABC transporter permease [Acholeplasmataceae bacterium]
MKKKHSNLSRYIFLILVMIFIYAPIISIAVFSFNEANSLTRWSGFTFQRYIELFTDRELFNYTNPRESIVFMTIWIAVISTFISTILGTLAAIALTQSRKIIRDLTLSVNNIPIVSPEIITGVSLLVLFGALQIAPSYNTMLLAHIAFSTPYVLITVYPKVKSLDPNIADAAYDLGASPLKALFKVILPQIKVAIIAGAALAFTMSFDDFIISYFVAGSSGDKNISIYLYTNRLSPKPIINALSTIILVIIGGKITYDYFKSGNKMEETE